MKKQKISKQELIPITVGLLKKLDRKLDRFMAKIKGPNSINEDTGTKTRARGSINNCYGPDFENNAIYYEKIADDYEKRFDETLEDREQKLKLIREALEKLNQR